MYEIIILCQGSMWGKPTFPPQTHALCPQKGRALAPEPSVLCTDTLLLGCSCLAETGWISLPSMSLSAYTNLCFSHPVATSCINTTAGAWHAAANLGCQRTWPCCDLSTGCVQAHTFILWLLLPPASCNTVPDTTSSLPGHQGPSVKSAVAVSLVSRDTFAAAEEEASCIKNCNFHENDKEKCEASGGAVLRPILSAWVNSIWIPLETPALQHLDYIEKVTGGNVRHTLQPHYKCTDRDS